jgi:hypothetical protein
MDFLPLDPLKSSAVKCAALAVSLAPLPLAIPIVILQLRSFMAALAAFAHKVNCKPKMVGKKSRAPTPAGTKTAVSRSQQQSAMFRLVWVACSLLT